MFTSTAICPSSASVGAAALLVNDAENVPRVQPAADSRVRRRGAAPELDMGALLRFKSMMALESENVQLARMCYDRLYAYERIACAHATARDGLRRLALELFQAYHRRDEAGRLSA